ncbi:MAG: hypothetical protein ACLFRV_12900 [Acidimicrobiales bacterium]
MARHRTLTALRQIVVGGLHALLAVLTSPLSRRWYNRWGATHEELGRPMPGDELVKDPKLGYTRAITIDAPPEHVWPWLAQIGQGRGGFYSFDGLENLIGCDIHSTQQILPDQQNLAVGDIVRSGQDHHICWTVMDLDPPHDLVLQGAGTPGDVEVPDVVDAVPDKGYAASTWQWVLDPVDGGRRTRLVVRQRCTYSPRQVLLWRIVEPLNFVMEREMLRGLKARAEAPTHATPP